MSAWIVYSKDGLAERCVLRSLEYGGTHMGERAVTATFDSPSEVAFEVFDYIEYRGEKFELEAVPTVKKTSDFNYEYELRFVSLKYELERCEMRDLVPNDNGVVYPTPLTFTFTGDVRYLVERIQACLNDLYGKGVWSIVVADDVKSEEKNISIAQQNCWNALALVSTTYGLNFYVKGRTITIGGEQSLVGHTFEYGKGNGLYEIERATDTGTGIVTKLRAYGASRNLDYSYPKKPEWSDSVLPVSFALSPLRLMLPSFKTDGKTDFVLADDDTIAKYGIREASMVYDDIYPTITGATYNGQAIDEIKAVDEVDETKNTFTVYLHDLGFDLEEHLTTSDAQISMKTGTLQGYTFNIADGGIERLESGEYKITLGRNSLENSEESGAYVPSKGWNVAKGDKFVLLNILMPQAYIREAENRLLARAKEYLAQYGKTNFSYNIGLHDKFLVEHPSVYDALVEGARLSVFDAELGISEDVTIQSITITENMEENILPQVKVTLNNEPSASTLDRIQGKLNDVANEVSANGFTAQSEIMSQYRKKLDKPFFEKLFVAIDKNGNEIAANDVTTPVAYILAKYDFASVGGVTMYAEGEDLDIPSIYNGLPIDNETLYWEIVDGSMVLKAKGGESGGGVADSVAWKNVYGKPLWITDTKPTYSYSEIEGTPDLSGYASKDEIPSLDGYATENWVTRKNYVDGTSLASELKKYVTIVGDETIDGLKNFAKGLQIGGLGITKSQDDVIYLDANLVVRGGITMYSDNTVDVGTIFDALPIDGNTIFWENGVLKANVTEGVITNITSDMVVEALGFTPYNASNPNGYISGITSEMVVSALGYTPLQNHQTIYALTIKKNGTSVGTYTPNSAKKTINIVVPTKVSDLENDENYATISDLDSRIDALINGAPTALDTLKEIADVLQDNVNSIGDIITTLGTKADKVIKISAGTGLSGGGTLEADRTLSLSESGVTAGTYKSVTVDEYGRVTDGTNPTTLAGYGITDAYTITQADALYAKYLPLTGGTLNGDLVLKTATSSTNTPKIIFVRGTSTDSYHDSYITNDGGAVTFGISYSGTDYNRVQIANKSMMPISSNTYAIGTDELRFSNVYSVLGNYSGEVSMQSANINGGKITYDATNKYWKLEGDLLVTGGVTMYASDSAFTPSTIMDGVIVDNVTILKDTETGALMINPELVLGGGGGEVSTVAWGNVLGKPSWITDTKPIYSYSEISGAPTLLSSFNNDVGFITSSALDVYLLASNYTASDILTKLLTVDGEGSGLNADLLDGYDGQFYKNRYTYSLSAGKYLKIVASRDHSHFIISSSLTLGGAALLCYYSAYGSGTKSRTRFEYIYYSPSYKVFVNNESGTRELYIYNNASSQTASINISSLNGYNPDAEVVDILPSSYEEYNSDYALAKLSSNVASATKLETPRTIWGQSFDGTANVSGDLTIGDGDIILNNNKSINVCNASGQSIEAIKITSGNTFIIGQGIAAKGYSTYLDGFGVRLRYGTSKTTGMILNSVGNVLIGASTDSGYKLDVNGTIHTNSSLWVDTIEMKKLQDNVLYIDGNLVVKGGITMFGESVVDIPTFMESIVTDETNLKVIDGVLTFVGRTGGGEADSVLWDNITNKPSWITNSKPSYSYSEISDRPTNLSQLTDDVVSGNYLSLSGGTMTGPITLTSGSSAAFDKTALSFISKTGTEQVRIGTNSSHSFGIYSIGPIYLKPNSSFTANEPGINLTSTEFTYNNYKIWHEGNDGSESGLDADLLDGYHVSLDYSPNTIPVRTSDGVLSERSYGFDFYSASVTNGWYRVYQSNISTNSGQSSVLVKIGKSYGNSQADNYVFYITITRLIVTITQISGNYSNAPHISKIRVNTETNNTKFSVDVLMNNIDTSESLRCTGFGAGVFQKATLVEEVTGYSVEFDIVRGCKSETYNIGDSTYLSGFTGNLEGNASTATKLQTARTIWGQSFDGTGNIDGVFTLLDTDRDSRPFNIGWLLYNERVALNMWSYSSSLGGFGDMCLGISSDVVSQGSLYFNSSTKNWGIGTNSPAYKLNVNGTIGLSGGLTLTGTDSSSAIIRFSRDSYNYIWAPSKGIISIQPNGLGLSSTVGYKFSGDAFYPSANNTYTLGASNKRWENTYSVLGDFSSNVTFGETITINGIPIYKSQDGVLYIEGNLAVKGGITMYATDAIDVPSIIDALPIASSSAKGIASFNPNDFSVVDGYVSFIGKGGVDESVLADYAKKSDLSNYLPLSGGQITGSISYPLEYMGNIRDLASSCVFDYTDSLTARGVIDNKRSLMGYVHNVTYDSWWNIISVRGDNDKYGMYICSSMTGYGSNLSWNRQEGYDGNWQGERVILDSVNWSDYVNVGSGNISGNKLTIDGEGYRGAYPALRLHIPNVTYVQFLMTESGMVELRYGDSGQSGGLQNLSIYTLYTENGLHFGGGEDFDNHGNIHIPNADGSWSWNVFNSNSSNVMSVYTNGNVLVAGGITMYSDIRKKTKLQDVELTLQQVADAPLIQHYYNSDEQKTTHVGSIAQYWASMNDWFCKLDNDGYYTMEIQNAALASAISIARELVKYESKTDRKIRLLKERVKELEDKIEKLENT